MGRNADNKDMRICGYADIYTRAEVFDPEARPWSNMRQNLSGEWTSDVLQGPTFWRKERRRAIGGLIRFLVDCLD